MSNFTIIAKTLFGLEEVLAEELQQLGATDIQKLTRAVQFQGDKAMLYRANLCLRTALKILKPIATFDVHNEQQLYDMVKDIDWSEYITFKQTFAIDSVVSSERFTHSKFMALKAKDAIADQFRERFRRRPSVDTRRPDLRINLHLRDRTCTLSLDSSGPSLDRRGYRLARTEAPINEVLAAGILKLAKWDGKTDLTDPMCGSGTFCVEAAMIAANIPPGRLRNFGFEKWNDFDRELWKRVKDDAFEEIHAPEAKILAADIDRDALGIAKENAMRAEVDQHIKFKKQDFLESKPQSESGFLVMNPPYGQRIEMEEEVDIEDFYSKIGDALKKNYAGHMAFIISANIPALKSVGLKTTGKKKLFNGALECRLHRYELYAGSRR